VRLLRALGLCLSTVIAACASCPPDAARGGDPPDAAAMHESEVLYLATPHPVVEAMLDLARVSAQDTLYDLGSGDGRIAIAAARRGARAIGIELDARMIARARCNALGAGVAHRVEFRQEDLFGADLRGATVVTLFLFPEMNRRLAPRLFAELPRGARIVSHRFGLGDRPPERALEVRGHPLLLWTVR
jgi:SAM-dependent methyltransferase